MDISDESDESDKPGGHVFCFLPLPLEQKSSTGLPVHINGYFSISQNRRHLKWPTAGHKPQSDKVMWKKIWSPGIFCTKYCQTCKFCILSVINNKRHLIFDFQALLWNQCLLKELVPKAYCTLIIDAINMNKSNPLFLKQERIVQVIYVVHRYENFWRNK